MSEPIISPWIFYLINVFVNLQGAMMIIIIFSGIGIIAFGVFTIIAACNDDEDEDEEEEIFHMFLKWLKRSTIIFLISLTILLLIPSKETMYTMLVADQVTYENVDALGDSAKDTVDYIFDKIEEVQNGSTESEGE